MRTPVNIERGSRRNPSGLPRPLARDAAGVLRPVPYTNADSGWGVLYDTRAHECEKRSLCLVCGDRVDEGRIFVSKGLAPVLPVAGKDDLRHHAVDEGPLHERCYKMTVAHCADVRQKMLQGEMFAVPYNAGIWGPLNFRPTALTCAT